MTNQLFASCKSSTGILPQLVALCADMSETVPANGNYFRPTNEATLPPHRERKQAENRLLIP